MPAIQARAGEAGKIFISYRREDASGHAGRLYDQLAVRFGAGRIFIDIDSIQPGEDFISLIEQTVGSCEVLIAVIGREWLGSQEGNRRRLDNPGDFVRVEIATALERGIRVIPVLVEGASMPRAEELPEPLQKLTRRNALHISDVHWRAGVDRLIQTIEHLPVPAGEPPPAIPPVGGSASGREPPVRLKRSLLLAGIFGVLGLALFAAWSARDQLGLGRTWESGVTRGAGNPEPAATAPTPRISPEVVSRTVRPRAEQSAETVDKLADGRLRHLYSVWIDAPPEVIREIAEVEYHYDHREFANPRTRSTTPANGFRDSYLGIGAVDADMEIVVVLRDGTRVPLQFNMWRAIFGGQAEKK